jgi:FkbM family methyltransferase
MFQHQGIWLPDGERHFPEWMDRHGELVDGKGTYQIQKLRAALEYCRGFRTAVDVGAHVGLWSMHLKKKFNAIEAFEPVGAFRGCFVKNLPPADFGGGGTLIALHSYALGAASGRVRMEVPALQGGLDTGGTHVAGAGNVEMRTLDSFALQDVDFIKIDVEGYEDHVIDGGRETIARCRPCIIVEQKPHKLGPNFGIKGTPAVDLLKSMSYAVRREMGGDYIMTFGR